MQDKSSRKWLLSPVAVVADARIWHKPVPRILINCQRPSKKLRRLSRLSQETQGLKEKKDTRKYSVLGRTSEVAQFDQPRF